MHPAKRFPYLSQYVHHARARGAGSMGGVPGAHIVAMVAGGAVAGVAIGAGSGSIVEGVFAGIAGTVGGLFGLFHMQRNRKLTPEARRELLAREATHCIGRLMELHRLHRDLDPASVILLEEGARLWDEGRRAGVDHDPAMRDLVLLYAPLLPPTPQPRGALEWVSEGVEVLSRTADHRPPPPFFNEARSIVEGMRDSGHESARAWEELASETTLPPGDPLRERLR